MYPASFKILLLFEVPGESITIDGKPAPMVTHREYTLSLSEKANLRHDLQSWRGREFTPAELDGFEVSTVVGVPCMLSVIHKTTAKKKVYAAISGISAMPKGVTCPPLWHKAVKFEIEDGRNAAFDSLPQWIKSKIELCEEWVRPWVRPAAAQQETEAGPRSPDFEPETDESDSVPF